MTGHYGYAGQILKVDLSSGSITHMPTSDYADLFLGGRGIAARIYWDEVPPQIAASAAVFATSAPVNRPPAGIWTAMNGP